MDFAEKKFEIAIFALIAVMVAGFGSLFKSTGVAKLISQELVYEMPRPKTFVGSDFDLSDRDIDRQYKNPFEKKNKEDAARNVNAKGVQPDPKAAEKAKQAAAKKAADKKKPKVDINVVDASNNHMSDMQKATPSNNNYGQQGAVAAYGNNETTTAKTQTEKETLSPAQWRSLIASEPTQANVTKLIKAYSAGEVDENTYLTIVGDLFASSKSENQALGIYAVNYIYTAKAFAMVTTTMDKLDTTNKAQAEGYLMAYTKTARLGLLGAALQSSNATVVAKAAEVVLAGYEQAKSATPTDPTTGNGNTGSSTAVAAYAKFVPIFQSLAQSSDTAIAQLANSALGQMQTTIASI